MRKNPFKIFLFLWFGQFISAIGSGLTSFALGIYLFQKTGSVTSFTMFLLCIFLPSVIVKPFGGVLADRVDRRLMMFIGDLGAAVGTLTIVLLMNHLQSGIWFIYLGTVISSVFGALQEPACKASVTDLLPKDLYDKGSGLMQLSSSSQYLISPLIAGILFSVYGITSIFIIDIASFVLALFTITWVRNSIGKIKQSNKTNNFLRDLKEGFGELLKQKGIFHLIVLTTSIMFFVGLLQSLFAPMLLSLTNAKTLGLIQTVIASGMIVGSLVIGTFGSIKKYVRILSLSLFFTGISFSLIGISTHLVLIALFGFMFFGFLPFVNTSIEVLIRNNIANEKQGRLWSLISTISYFGSVIAFLVAGMLADNIFTPLLMTNGILASSIGTIIGVGETRGIGLMFILSGAAISLIAFWIYSNKYISKLERQ